MDGIDTPIFLVAAERSGSTMLRLMLDNHPEVCLPCEGNFLVQPLPDGSFPPLDDFVEHVRYRPEFEVFGLDIPAQARTIKDVLEGFLRQMQQRSDKPIVGATVHEDFEVIPLLWPKARFIHLVRDGRDVCRSRVQMGWEGNVWKAAAPWCAVVAAWERLRDHISEESWVEVRYEDVLQQPEKSLRRLCEFIGVAYSPAMLEYHKDSTYGPPDAALAFQWKRKQTARQVRLVESVAGDTLDRTGYERSGLPPLRVGSAQRALLELHNKAGKALFRLKRYGLSLFVREFLARRLKRENWQKRLHAELMQVHWRHIK